MLEASLRQLHTWDTAEIQHYCRRLTETAIPEWQALGCRLEEPAQRAAHLFGLSLPANTNTDRLLGLLAERGVFVSLRGGAIRVSPNLYNDAADMDALTGALQEVLGATS